MDSRRQPEGHHRVGRGVIDLRPRQRPRRPVRHLYRAAARQAAFRAMSAFAGPAAAPVRGAHRDGLVFGQLHFQKRRREASASQEPLRSGSDEAVRGRRWRTIAVARPCPYLVPAPAPNPIRSASTDRSTMPAQSRPNWRSRCWMSCSSVTPTCAPEPNAGRQALRCAGSGGSSIRPRRSSTSALQTLSTCVPVSRAVIAGGSDVAPRTAYTSAAFATASCTIATPKPYLGAWPHSVSKPTNAARRGPGGCCGSPTCARTQRSASSAEAVARTSTRPMSSSGRPSTSTLTPRS